jgi:hypothetical protein
MADNEYFDEDGNKVSSETYVYLVRYKNKLKLLEDENKKAKEYLKLLVDYVTGRVFKFPMIIDIKELLNNSKVNKGNGSKD